MRTIAIIAAGGIALGVALALVIYAVRGPVREQRLFPCTAEWLKLAPTVSIDPTGRVASIGFTAPGPANCLAGAGKGVAVIEVDSADGKRLARRSTTSGPLSGGQVFAAFSSSVDVPALKLCKAKQPLHYTVEVIGLTSSGDSPMHYANGRCHLG